LAFPDLKTASIAGGVFTITSPEATTPALADLAAADAAEVERRRDPSDLRRRLEAATTIAAVLEIIAASTSLLTTLKDCKASVMDVNAAAELLLRAERRGGEIIGEMLERGEIGCGKGMRTYAALNINKKLRQRFNRVSLIEESEFERRLARAAAVASGVRQRHVPVSAIKMHISKWYVENGVRTRQIFAAGTNPAAVEAAAPEPEPTPPDIIMMIVPPGADKGAEVAAYRRQLAIYQALGQDWFAVDDIARRFGIAERTAHRYVARLVRLGLGVETRMSTRNHKYSRQVRRRGGV
jgi:DNA-binding MarR family transcriptional regulator